MTMKSNIFAAWLILATAPMANCENFFSGLELDDAWSTVRTSAQRNAPRDDSGRVTFDVALEANSVDSEISRAIALSDSGKRREALDILRALVVTTRFSNLKAKYFLAKQYVLVLEGNDALSHERKDFLDNLVAYLSEIRSELSNSELTADQRDFYRRELEDLQRRAQALGAEGVTVTVAAAPAPAVVSTEARPVEPVRDQPASTSFGGGATVDSRVDPDASNPVLAMNITDASQITDDIARQILQGTNLMSRSRNLQDAYGRLAYGWTYDSDYVGGQGLSLNSTVRNRYKSYVVRDLVFKEYTLLKQALQKYPGMPEISARTQPEKFRQWTERASRELTALPANQRLRVMQALMSHESGKIHWRNYRVTMGAAAEVGLGQFMPATAEAQNINPYDPEENIIGIARYLNQCIRDRGGDLRQGLATYNGGGGNYRTAQAQRYASSVTALV